MNKENILKWCEALESGLYEQDRDALITDFGYCCVGVADDIFNKGKLKKEYQTWCDEVLEKFETSQPFFKNTVKCLSGISAADFDKYAHMNDTGLTFVEIAATIREDFGLPPRKGDN